MDLEEEEHACDGERVLGREEVLVSKRKAAVGVQSFPLAWLHCGENGSAKDRKGAAQAARKNNERGCDVLCVFALEGDQSLCEVSGLRRLAFLALAR